MAAQQTTRYSYTPVERSRTALAAYRPPYQPWHDEVGVDKLRLTLRGTWEPLHPRSVYADYLLDGERSPEWMLRPDRNGGRIKLKSSEHAQEATTFRHLELTVFHRPPRRRFEADIVCNPTRTLAHLLHRFPAEDFLVAVQAVGPEDFFALAGEPPPRSLDGNDNWVADANHMRTALGRNAFGAFLPVFVHQLYRLTLQLVAPEAAQELRVDGTDLVSEGPDARVRLDCGNPAISQIETYFERQHHRARSAVHLAAYRGVFSLDDANAFMNVDRRGFARQRGSLSFIAPLPNHRMLSCYAKAPDRIRFEVRRTRRGRYGRRRTYEQPEARLLHMLEAERGNLLGACHWPDLAVLFTETPNAMVSDLGDLLSELVNAAETHGQDASQLIRVLLTEGLLPMRPDDDAQYTKMIKLLQRRRVLHRVSLRLRHPGGATKVAALRPEHQLTFEAVANALDGSFGAEPS